MRVGARRRQPACSGWNRRAERRGTGVNESGGGGRRFELELGGRAIGALDVIARSQVNRLVDAAGFREGVEVAHLDDGTRCGHLVVGRDGDVTGGADLFALKQDQRDAALGVHLGDNEGGRLVELIFELAASGAGSAGCVGMPSTSWRRSLDKDFMFLIAFPVNFW